MKGDVCCRCGKEGDTRVQIDGQIVDSCFDCFETWRVVTNVMNEQIKTATRMFSESFYYNKMEPECHEINVHMFSRTEKDDEGFRKETVVGTGHSYSRKIIKKLSNEYYEKGEL